MRELPRAGERIDKDVTVAVKRHVIDTNYFGHDDLAAFLGRSTDNHAVIAEMTLVEVHKKAAAFQARQLLKILCRHPRQVIILRSTLDHYRDRGDSKGLFNRLLEPQQTGSFGEILPHRDDGGGAPGRSAPSSGAATNQGRNGH